MVAKERRMSFNLVSLAYLASALVATGVAVIALHNRGVRGARELTLLMLSVALYAGLSAFEFASAGVVRKAVWMRLEYFGIAATPPLFLAFTSVYADWRTRSREIMQLFAWTVTGLTLVMVWTNGWHHLHWRSLFLDPVHSFLRYERGPYFWIWVGGAYVVIMTGTILLLRSAFQNRRLFRTQSVLLLLATLAPWIGNLLYLSPSNPFPGLDWTPFAFTLTGLLLAAAILRFGLFALLPVARSALIDGLREGLIVLDPDGIIVDANPAAMSILGHEGKVPIGRPCREVCARISGLLEGEVGGDGKGVEFELPAAEGARTFEADISPFFTAPGRLGGQLVVLRDITRRKAAETEQERLITKLRQALDQVNLLEGLLPICSRCHRIRTADGEWEPMETYMQEHAAVEFSHGICPDCAREIYPDYRIGRTPSSDPGINAPA
jgi:PAS domain S-box-containing protein